MSRVAERFGVLAQQVGRGDLSGAAGDVKGWVKSETVSYGFRHEFTQTYGTPSPSEVPLYIVPLDDSIAPKVFDVDGLNDRNRALLERRRAIWEAGFEGGHVAVTDDGDPAYLQWLIPPHQNDKVRDYWGPLFPDLNGDTALVEGAWVPPAYRKRNVMSQALGMISEVVGKTSDEDVRYAIAFVQSDNRGAMVGTMGAGYELFLTRTERWRVGRRSVDFEATAHDAVILS